MLSWSNWGSPTKCSSEAGGRAFVCTHQPHVYTFIMFVGYNMLAKGRGSSETPE